MIISNTVDISWNWVFEIYTSINSNWDNSKTGLFITIIFVILPMLIVYYLVLISEWSLSLLLFRHTIKFDIEASEHNENIKKWLTDNCCLTSKYMNFHRHDVTPFKHYKNEIRFLRKKDAAHFKLVWG